MAIEDGASGDVDGRIDVRWEVETEKHEPCLRIDWVETGRRTHAGSGSGSAFGTDVLEHAVAYDWAARCSSN